MQGSSTPVIPLATSVEERFQLLIEAVVDYGIFILSPEGNITSWNSGAAKLKGYSRADILGKHFSIFYEPDAVARGWPQEELRQAKLLGRFEDEGWRVRKDGSRFWANVIITAVNGPDGELNGFVKITRDLTERRAHEEELRRSEERFRLLVESVRDYGIFMLDVDGTVRGWNAGAQAMKGYTAEEIIGRHFSVFYTPEDQAAGKPERELATAMEQGRVEDEGWRLRKDGSAFWANVVVTAMRNSAGQLIGFSKVTRDMTERKRLQDLEASSRRMNEFLAMLAHELRNPLAPVRNAVSIMQLESLASPVLRNCRDIINRQLTHMTRLVDDLLDAGRISTGKIQLRRERITFADVVSRSVEVVRPLVNARGQSLSVDMPAEPVHAFCDPIRMSQVLQNLLVNAVKYTQEGGSIKLTVKPADDYLMVAVQDNGRGIAPEQLSNIFQLFSQGDGAIASDQGGLGIGLTLARSLVELHGGKLDAHSEGPGRGSTFSVRLPLSLEEAAHSAPQKNAGLPAPHRILVVDDNRDSADSISDILRLLGNEVESAYDGEKAVEVARRLSPGTVLLDLAMPGIDGFETLRQLRTLPGMQDATCIAMTGYGSSNDMLRTSQAGFAGHLTKPVVLDELVALLAQSQGTDNKPALDPA